MKKIIFILALFQCLTAASQKDSTTVSLTSSGSWVTSIGTIRPATPEYDTSARTLILWIDTTVTFVGQYEGMKVISERSWYTNPQVFWGFGYEVRKKTYHSIGTWTMMADGLVNYYWEHVCWLRDDKTPFNPNQFVTRFKASLE